MLYNRNKVISEAFREIGVVGLGASPEQSMYDEAADVLDQLLFNDQGLGTFPWQTSTSENKIKLNRNDGSESTPTIAVPADFVRCKTLKLQVDTLSGTFPTLLVASTMYSPISLVNHDDFFAEDQDEIADEPSKVYIQNLGDTFVVHVWPTVTVTQADKDVYLNMTYEKTVAKVTSDTSITYITSEMTKLYRLKLALELAPRYGIPSERKEELRRDIVRTSPVRYTQGPQKNAETQFIPSE
jgi:hypothetical protein